MLGALMSDTDSLFESWPLWGDSFISPNFLLSLGPFVVQAQWHLCCILREVSIRGRRYQCRHTGYYCCYDKKQSFISDQSISCLILEFPNFQFWLVSKLGLISSPLLFLALILCLQGRTLLLNPIATFAQSKSDLAQYSLILCMEPDHSTFGRQSQVPWYCVSSLEVIWPWVFLSFPSHNSDILADKYLSQIKFWRKPQWRWKR